MDIEQGNKVLTINGQKVNISQKVEIVWSDELQTWVPKIVEIINDVENGKIKTTWKTHLLWIIITILSTVSTYYLATSTSTVPNADPSSQTIDTVKIDTTLNLSIDSNKLNDTLVKKDSI